MRSILKAIIFSVLFTGGLIAISFAANLFPQNLVRLAYGILGSFVIIFITLVFIRVDKTKLAATGLKPGSRTILNFLIGFAAGLLIMGLMAFAVLYFYDVRIESNQKFDLWMFSLLAIQIFFLAMMEEVGFRGYSLVVLRNDLGVRQAIIISSILFALYHIANGWSIASSFYGPAVWGLIFASAAIYTKGIAAPTGLHFAANLTTSAIGEQGNTSSLWTIHQADIQLSNSQGVRWELILPSIFLLIFAIFCMEYFIRKKNIST